MDPTDDDSSNPYNQKSPTIEGAKDITINASDNFDINANVKAYDTCENEITNKMTIVGRVNTFVKGKYLVTYRVEDYLHRTAQKTITVTVK